MIEHVPRSSSSPGPAPDRFRLRSPHPADVRLTAAIMAITTVPYTLHTNDIHWGTGRFLLEASSVLPLIWRRRYPISVALLSASIALVITATVHPSQPFPYSVLIDYFTIGSELRGRARAVMISLFATGDVVAEFLHGQWNNADDYFLTFLTSITALLLGILTQTQRGYAQALEERAEVLEREREAAIGRAAATERARIARDMHDVVGHAVALMVVQAEAGPLLVRAKPEKAEAAFEAISEAGRDAMAQLRRLLGVLKQEDEVALRAPQPTLASVDGLVEGVRRSGLAVSLVVEGVPFALAADAEAAAFRVVQEALTNTLKHGAGASQAEVRLSWWDEALWISVADDGRGAGAPAGVADGTPPLPAARVGWTGAAGGATVNPAPLPAARASDSASAADAAVGTAPQPVGASGGHGLVGLRERLAAVGGSLAVRPMSGTGAGFTVAAWIPAPDRPPS